MGSQSNDAGADGEPDSQPPMEVEVDMSRADWLADIEVAVTPKTPDPLAGKHGDKKPDNG